MTNSRRNQIIAGLTPSLRSWVENQGANEVNARRLSSAQMRMKTPKDACGLALIWGWVDTCSAFWAGVEGRTLSVLCNRLNALAPFETSGEKQIRLAKEEEDRMFKRAFRF